MLGRPCPRFAFEKRPSARAERQVYRAMAMPGDSLLWGRECGDSLAACETILLPGRLDSEVEFRILCLRDTTYSKHLMNLAATAIAGHEYRQNMASRERDAPR